MTQFKTKRVYDEPSSADGYRVLVDRLWPRGVSKEAAQLDEWAKDLAPSPGLRKWFDHQPDKFVEFTERYQEELSNNSYIAQFLKLVKNERVVSLLYGAKDLSINHAVILQQFLEK